MPISKDELNRQLVEIGSFHEFYTRKELNYLPEILQEGEIIQAVTSGFYEGSTWLITITQMRVLFLDKGLLYGLKQIELPIAQISAISHQVGLVLGTITVSTSAGSKQIQTIPKKYVVKTAETLSRLIMSKATQKPAAMESSTDTISQLERLAKLRDQSILTEAEFQTQKQKLLGQ